MVALLASSGFAGAQSPEERASEIVSEAKSFGKQREQEKNPLMPDLYGRVDTDKTQRYDDLSVVVLHAFAKSDLWSLDSHEAIEQAKSALADDCRQAGAPGNPGELIGELILIADTLLDIHELQLCRRGPGALKTSYKLLHTQAEYWLGPLTQDNGIRESGAELSRECSKLGGRLAGPYFWVVTGSIAHSVQACQYTQS